MKALLIFHRFILSDRNSNSPCSSSFPGLPSGPAGPTAPVRPKKFILIFFDNFKTLLLKDLINFFLSELSVRSKVCDNNQDENYEPKFRIR